MHPSACSCVKAKLRSVSHKNSNNKKECLWEVGFLSRDASPRLFFVVCVVVVPLETPCLLLFLKIQCP